MIAYEDKPLLGPIDGHKKRQTCPPIIPSIKKATIYLAQGATLGFVGQSGLTLLYWFSCLIPSVFWQTAKQTGNLDYTGRILQNIGAQVDYMNIFSNHTASWNIINPANYTINNTTVGNTTIPISNILSFFERTSLGYGFYILAATCALGLINLVGRAVFNCLPKKKKNKKPPTITITSQKLLKLVNEGILDYSKVAVRIIIIASIVFNIANFFYDLAYLDASSDVKNLPDFGIGYLLNSTISASAAELFTNGLISFAALLGFIYNFGLNALYFHKVITGLFAARKLSKLKSIISKTSDSEDDASNSKKKCDLTKYLTEDIIIAVLALLPSFAASSPFIKLAYDDHKIENKLNSIIPSFPVIGYFVYGAEVISSLPVFVLALKYYASRLILQNAWKAFKNLYSIPERFIDNLCCYKRNTDSNNTLRDNTPTPDGYKTEKNVMRSIIKNPDRYKNKNEDAGDNLYTLIIKEHGGSLKQLEKKKSEQLGRYTKLCNSITGCSLSLSLNIIKFITFTIAMLPVMLAYFKLEGDFAADTTGLGREMAPSAMIALILFTPFVVLIAQGTLEGIISFVKPFFCCKSKCSSMSRKTQVVKVASLIVKLMIFFPALLTAATVDKLLGDIPFFKGNNPAVKVLFAFLAYDAGVFTAIFNALGFFSLLDAIENRLINGKTQKTCHRAHQFFQAKKYLNENEIKVKFEKNDPLFIELQSSSKESGSDDRLVLN